MGRLPSVGGARMLTEDPVRQRIYAFAVSTSVFFFGVDPATRTGEIKVFDSANLNALGQVSLPKMVSGGKQVDVDEFCLFPSSDGRGLYMLVKAVWARASARIGRCTSSTRRRFPEAAYETSGRTAGRCCCRLLARRLAFHTAATGDGARLSSRNRAHSSGDGTSSMCLTSCGMSSRPKPSSELRGAPGFATDCESSQRTCTGIRSGRLRRANQTAAVTNGAAKRPRHAVVVRVANDGIDVLPRRSDERVTAHARIGLSLIARIRRGDRDDRRVRRGKERNGIRARVADGRDHDDVVLSHSSSSEATFSSTRSSSSQMLMLTTGRRCLIACMSPRYNK